MLSAWTTAPSNTSMPWYYGKAGLVSGPIIMILIQALGAWVTVRSVEIAQQAGAMTFGELGKALGGARGEFFFEAA